MDVFEFLNTGGFETRVNPRYNPKSKKNTEPAEIKILNLDGVKVVGELSKKINKSESTIYKYERDEVLPDILTVLEICNAFLLNYQIMLPLFLNLVARVLLLVKNI